MGRRTQIMAGARKAVRRMTPVARSVVRDTSKRYGAPLISKGISKGIKKIKNRF